MGWFLLLVAASMEVLGVVGLKMFSMRKSVLTLLIFAGGFGLSYVFLYLSLNYLNMSIAYSVWAGIGTAGGVLINMLLFGESKSLARFINVGIIVIGVVGLKLVS
ncbi:MAG: DMT family transporter [Campylobacteraceae bacterium]